MPTGRSVKSKVGEQPYNQDTIHEMQTEIKGLFRRPEEIQEGIESPFKIRLFRCESCDRWPCVGAYDIRGNWVSEEDQWCFAAKNKVLTSETEATAFVELETKIPDFGDKSLEINHQISLGKWYGKSVQRVRRAQSGSYTLNMPYGYACNGTPSGRI